jgi:predicted AAA+ superfamily ATPase
MFRHRQLLDRILPVVESPEAVVITGMRRVGKTTLLREILAGIESDNKIFIDLENPVNRKYFEDENYDRTAKALEFLGGSLSKKLYVFLDEVQHQKNIPSVVKYLMDRHGVKFFLAGSAGFYLKNLFSESLGGRKFMFELYPLTLTEFLVFKDARFELPPDPAEVTPAIHQTLSPLVDEYVRFGGFPGVVLKDATEEKEMALDDIFSSFFNMEVVQIGDFRRNDVVRDLMLLLLQRTGSGLDVQKLAAELGVSRPTIAQYLSFLDGTYFISTVMPFSRGRDSEIRKKRKVYACDCGLAGRMASLDPGRLFENSVFQILRVGRDLRYYRRKNGPEIDFIVDGRHAYEVKTTAHPQDVRRLRAAAKTLGIEKASVISRAHRTFDGVTYPYMLHGPD